MTLYPRTEYEMTEADLKAILDACRPVPMIMVGGVAPPSQQDNANRAWAALGKKMGFDSLSVRPIGGKGQRFFTAIPSETEEAKQERMAAQKEKERQKNIARLSTEILERQQQLAALVEKEPGS